VMGPLDDASGAALDRRCATRFARSDEARHRGVARRPLEREDAARRQEGGVEGRQLLGRFSKGLLGSRGRLPGPRRLDFRSWCTRSFHRARSTRYALHGAEATAERLLDGKYFEVKTPLKAPHVLPTCAQSTDHGIGARPVSQFADV
jgi:hypothetical protein